MVNSIVPILILLTHTRMIHVTKQLLNLLTQYKSNFIWRSNKLLLLKLQTDTDKFIAKHQNLNLKHLCLLKINQNR